MPHSRNNILNQYLSFLCASFLLHWKFDMLSMAEFGNEILQNNQLCYAKKNCWVIMENNVDHHHHETTSSSSSLENSISSDESIVSSSSSSDLNDDASSSSSSSNSNGPLYELSELMAQLPIKRGLSKYFQGKSQSFTSLSKVMSVEELAKKENPFNARRRIKACKSFAGGLDAHRSSFTISKKPSRSSSVSFASRRSNAFLGTKNSNTNNNLPPIPTTCNY